MTAALDESSPSACLPQGLPQGSRIEHLALQSSASCELLLIPLTDDDAEGPLVGGDLDRARTWVREAAAGNERPPLELPVQLRLYGVDVIWSPSKVAAVAAAERFAIVRDAIYDFTATEAELSIIEQQIDAAWPDYERDLPLAYGFSETTAQLRDGLQDRYGRVMSLAGRLARISRRIHEPAPQPPTLAGQIGERLRERLRLADREEAADGCLEVLTAHYEACGQRASDFAIARRESLLSWTIIILLAMETILLAVDLLSANAGS